MFLFARLVLDNLYDQPSKAALYEEMKPDIFPIELNHAFVIDRAHNVYLSSEG